jgi:phosphate transport system permease protein
MTEGNFSCYCWNTLFGFGEYDICFPVGVLAAIYMSEYVKDGWPKKIIKQMTNNLAGVPSIVLGFWNVIICE